MRVVVYGGRDFANRRAAYAILDHLHASRRFTVVIHGDYRGADHLARDWARANDIPDEPYPANWKLHRRAAGPIRNNRMVVEGAPDFGVEFPGGDGTRDMRVRLARAGIEYCIVEAPPPTKIRPHVVRVDEWWKVDAQLVKVLTGEAR